MINLDGQTLKKIIEAKLLFKESMSVIRYGDGESMVFGDNLENTHFIFKKVMGYVPTPEEIETMKVNLIDAYEYCDVIGFPTEKHLSREDQWRHTMTYFNRCVSPKRMIAKTSIDIFYDMQRDGLLVELLKSVEKLNYVSCRNLDDVFKNKFGIKEVNSFIIAPEPTFTSGYVGERHFPDQFNKIFEWISELDCSGALCLVGAGIPGKIYNNWFADSGGVSLDIGSMFDGWAGWKTRGAGRGMDVEDTTNKL